jgi:hypothetical protein
VQIGLAGHVDDSVRAIVGNEFPWAREKEAAYSDSANRLPYHYVIIS